MFNRIPDKKKYAAAACYNKGYHLKNPNGIAAKGSVKLEMGLLHTKYEM